MSDITNFSSGDYSSYADKLCINESVYRISEEFEKDCRRYNRAFTDEQEVSTK